MAGCWERPAVIDAWADLQADGHLVVGSVNAAFRCIGLILSLEADEDNPYWETIWLAVTLSFKTIHAFVIVHHESRRAVHFGVTDHPTDA